MTGCQGDFPDLKCLNGSHWQVEPGSQGNTLSRTSVNHEVLDSCGRCPSRRAEVERYGTSFSCSQACNLHPRPEHALDHSSIDHPAVVHHRQAVAEVLTCGRSHRGCAACIQANVDRGTLWRRRGGSLRDLVAASDNVSLEQDRASVRQLVKLIAGRDLAAALRFIDQMEFERRGPLMHVDHGSCQSHWSQRAGADECVDTCWQMRHKCVEERRRGYALK